MLSSLLHQLRHHYPTASLTADLLMVHDGSFVVRSQIAINGIIIASGLAAAPTVEAAEDHAKLRALKTMDLGNTPDLTPVSAPSPPAETPAAPATSAPPRPAAKSSTPAPEQPPEESIQPVAAPASESSAPPTDDTTTPADSHHPPVEIAAPATAATANGATTQSSPSPPSPPAASPAPSPTAPGDSPIDLSDIIAQTDVELQRLGWTVAQGREYLESTYGKRSRHDLSDEELLEFLLYLEAQPNP